MRKHCGNCGNGPFASKKCKKKECFILAHSKDFQNWIPLHKSTKAATNTRFPEKPAPAQKPKPHKIIVAACTNSKCGWFGTFSECVRTKHGTTPLCPECRDTVETRTALV